MYKLSQELKMEEVFKLIRNCLEEYMQCVAAPGNRIPASFARMCEVGTVGQMTKFCEKKSKAAGDRAGGMAQQDLTKSTDRKMQAALVALGGLGRSVQEGDLRALKSKETENDGGNDITSKEVEGDAEVIAPLSIQKERKSSSKQLNGALVVNGWYRDLHSTRGEESDKVNDWSIARRRTKKFSGKNSIQAKLKTLEEVGNETPE
ncbi:hypothetical protein SUGI_0694070 [Cryptomeria japonica]|nr:hypothetical protein SUGI_0694070 [Cryptomeria japonica]